jgi:hypothetical protein
MLAFIFVSLSPPSSFFLPSPEKGRREGDKGEDKEGKEKNSLLIPPNLPKGDGTRPVPVGFLDTTRSLRCGFSSGFGSDYLSASACERQRARGRGGGTR